MTGKACCEFGLSRECSAEHGGEDNASKLFNTGTSRELTSRE